MVAVKLYNGLLPVQLTIVFAKPVTVSTLPSLKVMVNVTVTSLVEALSVVLKIKL